MKIKLGIIATEPHLSYLKKIEMKLKDFCTFKYLIAKDNTDSEKLYHKNCNYVDGFIFSGILLYLPVEKKYKDSLRPCYIISDDEANIYKNLLSIVLNNKQMDFSRVYIDLACEMNNYLNLEEIFPKDKMPYTLPWKSTDAKEITGKVLKNHIRLWKENKIDLSITKFGTLLPELDKHGIKYIYLYPSEKYILDIFIKAINELAVIRLNTTQPVVAHISLVHTSENEVNYEADLNHLSLQRELIEFCQKYDYDFTIQKKDNYVEIYTNYGDFINITENLKTCTLQVHLNKELCNIVKIGWGSGSSLQQAKLNALKANKYTYQHEGGCSYFIGADQSVVGPLEESSRLEYSQDAGSEIIELSNELGINNINLQKIISLSKKIGTNKLSSEDVAQCLSITLKGANRILNKIEDKSMAKIVNEKRENSKGRPKKYYELIFLDEVGDLNIK